MRDLAAVCLDESTILIICTIGSAMWSMTLGWIKCFFPYLSFLERTFGWTLSPFACSLLFALYFEWFLNTNADKKSNAVCIFANLCSTLVCGWS